MLYLAAIVVCIALWPITLAVLALAVEFFILKVVLLVVFGAVVGVGYSFIHPPVIPPEHPGNLTSEPGQMFFFAMLALLAFCAFMAWRQSKEEK